jgi:hypothetical protein
VVNSLSEKAPTSHASNDITYGVGTDTDYGHVKLSDSVSTLDSSSGTAVSPKAVDDGLSSLFDDIITAAENAANTTTVPDNVAIELSNRIDELANDLSAIDVGVTSFNGSKGDINYTAPVTSVNGMTGDITIQSNSGIVSDIFNESIDVNKQTTKTVTFSNVVINKPLYIVVKAPASNPLHVSIVSGTYLCSGLGGGASGSSVTSELVSGGVVKWITCIPMENSVSIGIYNTGTTTAYISVRAFQ